MAGLDPVRRPGRVLLTRRRTGWKRLAVSHLLTRTGDPHAGARRPMSAVSPVTGSFNLLLRAQVAGRRLESICGPLGENRTSSAATLGVSSPDRQAESGERPPMRVGHICGWSLVVQARRRTLRLTQAEVADQAEVGRQWMIDFEGGKDGLALAPCCAPSPRSASSEAGRARQCAALDRLGHHRRPPAGSIEPACARAPAPGRRRCPAGAAPNAGCRRVGCGVGKIGSNG